jgi:hypothetical protein
MFSILIVGGEYDGQFCSKDGFCTKNPEKAIKFENSYWAKNICYHWNKDTQEGDSNYLPIRFIDQNGNFKIV